MKKLVLQSNFICLFFFYRGFPYNKKLWYLCNIFKYYLLPVNFLFTLRYNKFLTYCFFYTKYLTSLFLVNYIKVYYFVEDKKFFQNILFKREDLNNLLFNCFINNQFLNVSLLFNLEKNLFINFNFFFFFLNNFIIYFFLFYMFYYFWLQIL